MDGLGGLPHPETGRTELESAWTPHLDRLAKESACGFTMPVAHGVTPGSGPGHLALFGYDPLVYNIGRGVLEAVGIDFDLQPADVAARGNFCTSTTRAASPTAAPAGSAPSAAPRSASRALRTSRSTASSCSSSRCGSTASCFVLRGEGLSDDVADTDPQRRARRRSRRRAPRRPTAKRRRRSFDHFVERGRAHAGGQVAREHAAAARLREAARTGLRWREVFKLRAAAVAHYPMYRGLAKLVGMDALTVGPTLEDSIATLRENWDRFDFFFVHYKYTDAAGEDGDFDRKVAKLEEVDAAISALVELEPDVLMVTGDHSTPAVMAAHSWHPVPFMLHAGTCAQDDCDAFNEVSLRRARSARSRRRKRCRWRWRTRAGSRSTERSVSRRLTQIGADPAGAELKEVLANQRRSAASPTGGA